MTDPTKLVSVIIVNWNTCRLTADCIASVYKKNLSVPLEVIVVDNNSSDDSVPWLEQNFPQVDLIRNTTNVGFARANNQAIQKSRGDIILLLNSDTVLKTLEPLQTLAEYFAEHPETAVLGARLLYPDGRVQSLGRHFWSLKKCMQAQLLFMSAPFWQKKHVASDPIEADYVDGAFFAIPRRIVDEVGLMDETFFMYAEDLEWCARIRKSGYRIVVLPEIEVIHFQGASSRQNFSEMLLQSARNTCRFIYQHEGPLQAKAAYIVHTLGMGLRIPLSIVRKPDLVKSYWLGFRKSLAMWRNLDHLFQDGR